MELALFFVLALVAVAAGIGVIAQRSAARSALFLLVNFCSLAGLYVLLNAQFVAMVQVIVYAGAVVVLFLFVVMLLGAERAEETPDPLRFQWVAAGLLGVLLLVALVWALVTTDLLPADSGVPTDFVPQGMHELGAALLTTYAIPFELVSVVLLVAIIGAVVLAKKRLEE